jgi:hypothetical protein
VTERVRLDSPADAGAFLARIVRLDPAALVRLRPHGEGTVALWSWLTVGALAVRVVPGAGPADAVVAASALLAGIGADLELPPRRDAEWRGPLPGAGFRRLDELPADVVAGLAAAGERTFREAAEGGSRSAARALTDAVLDHVAVTVTGPGAVAGRGAVAGPGAEIADVPQRAIQALSSLGFLGSDPVAVDVTAAWLRLVGTYGAVYLRRGTGLGVLAL